MVIGSHLGRPTGPSAELSMKHVQPRLAELLGTKVQLAPDCVGEDAKMANALNDGEVLLLENLRFHEEEEGKPCGLAADATEEQKAAAKRR